MTGFGEIFIIALVITVPLAVVAWARAGGPVRVVLRRSFRCPIIGADVTVTFREEVWDGRAVEDVAPAPFRPPAEVLRCSALLGPAPPACGKACRSLPELRR